MYAVTVKITDEKGRSIIQTTYNQAANIDDAKAAAFKTLVTNPTDRCTVMCATRRWPEPR